MRQFAGALRVVLLAHLVVMFWHVSALAQTSVGVDLSVAEFSTVAPKSQHEGLIADEKRLSGGGAGLTLGGALRRGGWVGLRAGVAYSRLATFGKDSGSIALQLQGQVGSLRPMGKTRLLVTPLVGLRVESAPRASTVAGLFGGTLAVHRFLAPQVSLVVGADLSGVVGRWSAVNGPSTPLRGFMVGLRVGFSYWASAGPVAPRAQVAPRAAPTTQTREDVQPEEPDPAGRPARSASAQAPTETEPPPAPVIPDSQWLAQVEPLVFRCLPDRAQVHVRASLSASGKLLRVEVQGVAEDAAARVCIAQLLLDAQFVGTGEPRTLEATFVRQPPPQAQPAAAETTGPSGSTDEVQGQE